MSHEKTLIVVIGLGEMGLIHAANLSKHRSILLGLACTRPDTLSTTAQSLCADRIYSTYDAAFADPEVAAVVIATSPPTHPDLISKAAAANKHIFAEKPLGYDSPSISAALHAVQEARVRFMSGFMRRWDADYIAAREKIVSGQIGDPVVLKCMSGDPEYPEKYHRGGAKHSLCLDLAVHDIDLARWLTGSEVGRVYVVLDAMTYPTLKETGDGDVAVAVLEMTSGTKVMVHLSRALDFGYNVTTQVFCKHGMVEIGELKQTAMVTVSEKARATDVVWDFSKRFEGAFDREMKAFVDLVHAKDEEAESLVKKNQSYAGMRDGLVATIVGEALVKSSMSGMPEVVPYN